MKRNFIILVLVGLGMTSCNLKEKQRDDEVAGVYAREYSFKVSNTDNGKEIGMRRVRDTIFIRLMSGEYEVSNKKWKINDYDEGSWQSMEHSDDRQFSTYLARFDDATGKIISETNPPIVLNPRKETLTRGEGTGIIYSKVK